MDGIIDKLLEAIKDKMSKKQVIAIVAMIVLYMLTAHPGYITGVAIVAIAIQGILDKERKNELDTNSKTDSNALADD